MEIMFRGRFEHTIDPKGRISIPSKFREVLKEKYEEKLMVTNFDGCLYAYPTDEWYLLEEKVSRLSSLNRKAKSLQRFFTSAVAECPIDKLGRILIPPTLRDYAKLEKDVIVIGVLKRIEVWSKKNWEPEITRAQEYLENLSDEDLVELDI
jgi:MraZ protein